MYGTPGDSVAFMTICLRTLAAPAAARAGGAWIGHVPSASGHNEEGSSWGVVSTIYYRDSYGRVHRDRGAEDRRNHVTRRSEA